MGIFVKESTLFTAYRVKCRSKHRILGGTPNDSQTIERWLRKRLGEANVEDTELKRVMYRTLHDLGADLEGIDYNNLEKVPFSDLQAVSESMAVEMKGQSFKRDSIGQPCIESRCIKAGIKEATNALFAKQKWGPTGKGPKNFVAEHVFVEPRMIPLGEPTTKVPVCMIVGHPTGPQGPRSTLNYHEYVDHADYWFILLMTRIAEKFIDWENWKDMWVLGEQLGHGTGRSMAFGQYDVLAYEKLEDYKPGDCFELGWVPLDRFSEESWRLDGDVKEPADEFDEVEFDDATEIEVVEVGAD